MISMRQLLIVVGLGIASLNFAQESTPVPGAMYAEVHGIATSCARVYVGSIDIQPVHGRVKSAWCRNTTPCVHFYDAHDNIMYTEYIYEDDLENNLSKQGDLLKKTQSRLTVLPEVASITIVSTLASIKLKNHRVIELYDKDGHRIAAAGYRESLLKKNDLLPEQVIKEIENKVSNPEALKTMPIKKATSELDREFPVLTSIFTIFNK